MRKDESPIEISSGFEDGVSLGAMPVGWVAFIPYADLNGPRAQELIRGFASTDHYRFGARLKEAERDGYKPRDGVVQDPWRPKDLVGPLAFERPMDAIA